MTLEALDGRGAGGSDRRTARECEAPSALVAELEAKLDLPRKTACSAPGAQGLVQGAQKAEPSTEAQGPRRILAHIGAIRLALAGKPLPATMERRGGELLTRRSPTASARDKQSTHRFQLPGQLVSGFY
jgi:hypothetical protein